MIKPLPYEDVLKWFNDRQIKTLNAAGNRESTSPGLQEFVTRYLIKLLSLKGWDIYD